MQSGGILLSTVLLPWLVQESSACHMQCQNLDGINFGWHIRKLYAITKQQERWTEEEHNRFLEGLTLYGRAWQRIEGYYFNFVDLICCVDPSRIIVEHQHK